MFGSLGFPEILLILVLALLVFGPKRLPEVGRTIGKGLSEFRRASADLKRTVNAELALDEDEHTRSPRRPEAARALAGTGGAAGAGAGNPAEKAVEVRPAEGTAARTPATAVSGAGERSPDAPPAEQPLTGAEPSGAAAGETAAAEEDPAAETEPATTH